MYLPVEDLQEEENKFINDEIEASDEHIMLSERLKKTLYYGKMPKTERPSMPATDIAVGYFQQAAPKHIGKIDQMMAADIGRRACVSPCALMMSMIYIERLRKTNPDYLNTVASSDLFLISMMVASKFLYDEGVDEEVFNDEWAESANLDLEDINQLERSFLMAIDWNLFVKPDEFYSTLHGIEEQIAKNNSIDRGFFTYTDLMVLAEDGRLFESMKRIMKELSMMLMVCSMTYLAGIMTVIGSVAVVSVTKQHASVAMTTMTAPGHSVDMTTPLVTPDEDMLSDVILDDTDEFGLPGISMEMNTDNLTSTNMVDIGSRIAFARKPFGTENSTLKLGSRRLKHAKFKTKQMTSTLTRINLMKDTLFTFFACVVERLRSDGNDKGPDNTKPELNFETQLEEEETELEISNPKCHKCLLSSTKLCCRSVRGLYLADKRLTRDSRCCWIELKNHPTLNSDLEIENCDCQNSKLDKRLLPFSSDFRLAHSTLRNKFQTDHHHPDSLQRHGPGSDLYCLVDKGQEHMRIEVLPWQRLLGTSSMTTLLQTAPSA